MYAIETRKRKFDRILDTIKDHANPNPSVSSAPSNGKRKTNVLEESESTKKRRLYQSLEVRKPSLSSSRTKSATYLPASREAFLERLETFGPISKWHIASTDKINASAWAKRGWQCVGIDTVGCQACNENLHVQIDVDTEGGAENTANNDDNDGDDGEEDFESVASLKHRLLVERYQDMIITAHESTCPWRKRGCDDSIQRISGLLSTKTALEGLKTRYDSLSQLRIPDVVLPSESRAQVKDDDIERFRFGGSENRPIPHTLRLAMAGWQGAMSREDVAECRACFRSLGLWLYRGETPIMERLDAVESHLEYCPWRSGTAQKTIIEIEGEQKEVPAWELVVRAVNESVEDRVPDEAAEAVPEREADANEHLGEADREVKVKRLLRRVRDLKKPFNVKSLLRKRPVVNGGRAISQPSKV